MTHIFKKIIFTLCFTLLFTGMISEGFADTLRLQQLSNPDFFHNDVSGNSQKVYLSQNQICITEDGMFANLEGMESLVSIEALFRDDAGMYTILRGERGCKKHGDYCPSCSGCHPNNICQFRCKCPPRR